MTFGDVVDTQLEDNNLSLPRSIVLMAMFN